MSLSSDLTHGDVTRILQIVDQLSDVEVRLEVEGMKLHVRKFAPGATGTPGVAMAPVVQLEAAVPTVPLAPSAPPTARSATAAAAEMPVSGAPQPTIAAPGADQAGLVAVRSPMLGRFFRAASPTDAPYVEVGSKVEPEDTVCVVEVMKLFSTVNAGVRGTVVQIAVENGAMVEHDAVLFMVRPE